MYIDIFKLYVCVWLKEKVGQGLFFEGQFEVIIKFWDIDVILQYEFS